MINDVTSFSFFANVITQTQGEMGSTIYDQENHKTQKKEDNIRIFRLYLEQLLIIQKIVEIIQIKNHVNIQLDDLIEFLFQSLTDYIELTGT